MTRAFFRRASVSKYALVTSSVPSVWFFNSPRLRTLLKKTIQIFRKDLDDNFTAQLTVCLFLRTRLWRHNRVRHSPMAVIFCSSIVKADDLKFDGGIANQFAIYLTLREAFRPRSALLHSSSLPTQSRYPRQQAFRRASEPLLERPECLIR